MTWISFIRFIVYIPRLIAVAGIKKNQDKPRCRHFIFARPPCPRGSRFEVERGAVPGVGDNYLLV